MMKHIWILLIAILAMSAIAAIADEPSECAALKTAYDNASTALSSAKEEKRLADIDVSVNTANNILQGIADGIRNARSNSGDDGLSRIGRDIASERRSNALARALLRQSAAQRALDAAQATYDSAQGNYEMCVASHIARWVTGPSCGHRYIHAFESRHNLPFIFDCGHSSYLCKSSEHKQVTCSSQTVSVNFDSGWWSRFYVTGCGATYWECQGSSAHRILKNPTVRRACSESSSNGGNGGNGGGNGGNGGGTGGGNGGGTGGGDSSTDNGRNSGDSSTRVRCGNTNRGAGACTSGGYASSRTAHRTTCSAGHTYWNCNRTAAAWHATSHTCTRSGCGQTYTNCSKGNGTCSGGRYTWHD